MDVEFFVIELSICTHNAVSQRKACVSNGYLFSLLNDILTIDIILGSILLSPAIIIYDYTLSVLLDLVLSVSLSIYLVHSVFFHAKYVFQKSFYIYKLYPVLFILLSLCFDIIRRYDPFLS